MQPVPFYCETDDLSDLSFLTPSLADYIRKARDPLSVATKKKGVPFPKNLQKYPSLEQWEIAGTVYTCPHEECQYSFSFEGEIITKHRNRASKHFSRAHRIIDGQELSLVCCGFQYTSYDTYRYHQRNNCHQWQTTIMDDRLGKWSKMYAKNLNRNTDRIKAPPLLRKKLTGSYKKMWLLLSAGWDTVSASITGRGRIMKAPK